MRRPVLAAAALVALAVVLAALPIGSDVYEGGEAREGLVVREMLRTGDWILALWDGSFVHALRGAGGPTRLVLALCLALAMLAKGPVGPGLVGLTALVSALANRRLGPALRLVRPLPVLVFLAVAGGWYGLAYHHRGMDFVAKQILSENGEALLGSSRFP